MVIAGCKVSAEMHNPYIMGRLGHQPYDPAPDPAIFERPLPKFDSVYDEIERADRKPPCKGAVRGRKPRDTPVIELTSGKTFDNMRQAADRFGLTRDQVYGCCHERARGHDATTGAKIGTVRIGARQGNLKFEWVK